MSSDEFKSMWDRSQLRRLYYLGWWPDHSKTANRYRIVRISGILLFLYDFIQLGPEFIALHVAVSKGSLKGTVLNLETTCMGILGAIKIIGLFMHEKKIKWISEKMEEMEKEGLALLDEEDYKAITERSRRGYSKISIFFHSWLLGLIQWCSRPPFLFYFGIKVFLVESWFAWDEYTTVGWCVAFVIQFVHITTVMLGYILIDCMYMSMLEMTTALIHILEIFLTKLDFSNQGVDSHPRYTLCRCVKFHQDLLRVCRELNKVIRVALSAYVIFITVILCLCVFECSSVRETGFYKTMNVMQLALNLTLTMLIYCWYCQQVSDKLSSDILRAAYNNNWYNGRIQDKKALNIFCTMTQKKVQFGFIVPANLETFETVLKSAFSCFNFLKAVSVKDSRKSNLNELR